MIAKKMSQVFRDTKRRYLLSINCVNSEVRYPPLIPPAIAPAPINPNNRFASSELNKRFASSQNWDVVINPNKATPI